MKIPSLRRCPYHLCGCDVDIEKETSLNEILWRVVADCGASGPWCKTKIKAVFYWNEIREPAPEELGR